MRKHLIILFLLLAFNAQARNFELPQVSKGDVLSAVWFNELLSRIEKANSAPTVEDILGEWSCISSIQDSSSYTSDGINNGWELDSNELMLAIASEISFSTVSGEYFIETASTAANPFVPRNFNTDPINTVLGTNESFIAFKFNLGGGSNDVVAQYEVRRLGDNRIFLIPAGTQNANLASVFCDECGEG